MLMFIFFDNDGAKILSAKLIDFGEIFLKPRAALVSISLYNFSNSSVVLYGIEGIYFVENLFLICLILGSSSKYVFNTFTAIFLFSISLLRATYLYFLPAFTTLSWQ